MNRYVRTVNGVVYETFKEAAQELNLIVNNEVFFLAFDELDQMQMPPAFRRYFATLLINNVIVNVL